jgi:hypothetical protein
MWYATKNKKGCGRKRTWSVLSTNSSEWEKNWTSQQYSRCSGRDLNPVPLWGPPILLTNGYSCLSPRGKSGRGREDDHLAPYNDEVKNGWSYTSTPPKRLHGSILKYRGKSTLLSKCKVVPVLYLTEHHAMKAYYGSGGISPRILDFGTRWEWSASRPGRFTPRERASSTNCIGGWVDPRAGLDAVVKRKIPSSCRDSNPWSSSP